MPIGEIRLFAPAFAPVGWQFCEGQVLNVSDHPELARRIGNTFGGDGKNTFALPDLRGRAAMHAGSGMKLGKQRTIPIEAAGQGQQVPAKIHIHHIIQLRQEQRMDEGEAFIGEIRIFAGNRFPGGWLPCDGRAMRIVENSALFALIGSIYALDHRSDIFWLPNLNGRMCVHPPSRDDLGNTVDAHDYDGKAQTKTHLGLRHYIASEGVFPALP